VSAMSDWKLAVWIVLVLGTFGCGDEEARPEVEACDTALAVTWSNWGEGFMLTHCSGCHAVTSRERNGAPVDVHFDTEEEVLENAASVVRVVLESQTMPPAGGILEDDLILLDAWLNCWAD
jgi:uncharacterized membrane protein